MKRLLRFFPSKLGRVLASTYAVLFFASFFLLLAPTPCQKSVLFPCTLIDVVLIPVYLVIWGCMEFLFATFGIKRYSLTGIPAQIPWVIGFLATILLFYGIGVLIENLGKKKKK